MQVQSIGVDSRHRRRRERRDRARFSRHDAAHGAPPSRSSQDPRDPRRCRTHGRGEHGRRELRRQRRTASGGGGDSRPRTGGDGTAGLPAERECACPATRQDLHPRPCHGRRAQPVLRRVHLRAGEGSRRAWVAPADRRLPRGRGRRGCDRRGVRGTTGGRPPVRQLVRTLRAQPHAAGRGYSDGADRLPRTRPGTPDGRHQCRRGSGKPRDAPGRARPPADRPHRRRPRVRQSRPARAWLAPCAALSRPCRRPDHPGAVQPRGRLRRRSCPARAGPGHRCRLRQQ